MSYRPITDSSPWWRSPEWEELAERVLGPDEDAPPISTAGAVHAGLCDGCQSRVPQPVTTPTGDWGTATVCRYHEDHE